MISPEQFAEMLRNAPARIPALLDGVVSKIAVSATAKAKSFIGVQQSDWPPLADSTKAQKNRLGFGSPPDFDPLLRTGAMRESYEPLILPNMGGVVSDSKTALYQEMGTARIPPRPVTAKAMIETIPELEAELGAASVKLLTFED